MRNASPRLLGEPFTVLVDPEFGATGTVTFEPDPTTGAMNPTVMVTDAAADWWGAALNPWLKQSKWTFRGPPGQEVPIMIQLSNGDNVYPFFEVMSNGDLELTRYKYQYRSDTRGPPISTAEFVRRPDGAFEPDPGIYKPEQLPKPMNVEDWDASHAAVLDGLLIAIALLLKAAATVGMAAGAVAAGMARYKQRRIADGPVSYTHLRAHETR